MLPQLLGLVSLELDLVHQPHTVSEFEPHGKQTLDTDSAHYHFAKVRRVMLKAGCDAIKCSTMHCLV
jgi:hypothetical protein